MEDVLEDGLLVLRIVVNQCPISEGFSSDTQNLIEPTANRGKNQTEFTDCGPLAQIKNLTERPPTSKNQTKPTANGLHI